jgi:hypothetical protein
MAAQSSKYPPVLDLHPDLDVAAQQLLAFLMAPSDPQRQKEFLAMQAVDLLEGAPARVSRWLEQVRAVTVVHSDYETTLARCRARIEDTLFIPAGGLGRLRDADSKRTWEAGFVRAQKGAAPAAGRLLLHIVQLYMHHPKLTASTKRALAVLEAWGKRVGPIPRHRDQPQVWSRGGSTAPVFGAMILALEYWSAHGLQIELAMRQAKRFRQLLSWMAWLRDFCLQHKPRGAAAPLLRPDKIVQLPPFIEPEQPPLGPLPPHLLLAATQYKAPMYV